MGLYLGGTHVNGFLETLMQLFERAALLLICLFFITRIPRFKETLQKNSHSPAELTLLTMIFCMFALFGTYTGIEVEGSLVNVRIIAIMAGGILFGPWVGIITGIVSGIHRYLIDIGGSDLNSVSDYEYSGRCGIGIYWAPGRPLQEVAGRYCRRDDLRNINDAPYSGDGTAVRAWFGHRL